MGELNTPYFLEQDGTIRNGQNEIVTEILDETTEYKELHKMIETLNGIGYLNLQLATAQAEVERLTADRAKLIEAVEQFLAWFGSSSQWERENRNAKPVTRKDVRGLRDALRFKDAEAQRIMEGK